MIAHSLTALLVACVLLAANRERNPRFTYPLPLERVSAEVGRAFYVRLGPGRSDADGVPSPLEVLEDGQPLGPAHIGHDDIRRLGGGRYSHWLTGLLFSTSDDSDPRTNGRRYEIRTTWDLSLLLVGLFGAALALNRSRWAARLREAHARPLPLLTFLLALALVQRGLALGLDADGTIPGSLAKGVPWSDARDWESQARRLAEGDIDWVANGYWRARRPLYYLILAGIYAWTGASVVVAQAANLLMGVVSVGFTFDAIRRLTSLPVAAAVAGHLALSPCDVNGQLLTMSEPLGDLCGAISLWALSMSLGATRPGLRWLVLAGAFLGLANLARPLTLLAVGALPLALLVVPRGWTRRDRALAGGALVVGTVLTVGPWLGLQRARHGIWSLSENTAEMLYGATSPDPGIWTPEIALLGPSHPIKARVDFYMAGVRRHVIEDPGGYLGRTASAFVDGMLMGTPPDRIMLMGAPRDRVLRGLVACAFLLVCGPRRRSSWFWAAALTVIIVLPYQLMVPAGVLAAVLYRAPATMIGVIYGATWLAMAVMRATDHRFSHTLEPLALALSGFATWSMLALVTGARAPTITGSWGAAATHLRRLAVVVVVVLVVGLGLCALRRPPARRVIELQVAREWVDRALAVAPEYEALSPRLTVLAVAATPDYVLPLEPQDDLVWDGVITTRSYPINLIMYQGVIVLPGTSVPLAGRADVVAVGVRTVQRGYEIFEAIALVLPDGTLLRADPAAASAHVAHITSALANPVR